MFQKFAHMVQFDHVVMLVDVRMKLYLFTLLLNMLLFLITNLFVLLIDILTEIHKPTYL